LPFGRRCELRNTEGQIWHKQKKTDTNTGSCEMSAFGGFADAAAAGSGYDHRAIYRDACCPLCAATATSNFRWVAN
jgi:hypothetical protein